MREFTADNHTLFLPEWVRYLAMDEDGAWYGYESAPTLHEMYGVWMFGIGRKLAIPGTENFAPKGIPTKWDQSLVVLD